MEQLSSLVRAGELAKRLQAIVASFDIDALELEQKKLLYLIRRVANEVRLDIRDYEYVETRAEQVKLGVAAVQRLADLRQNILRASEYDLFGAVDVAFVSAHIDQLIQDIT